MILSPDYPSTQPPPSPLPFLSSSLDSCSIRSYSCPSPLPRVLFVCLFVCLRWLSFWSHFDRATHLLIFISFFYLSPMTSSSIYAGDSHPCPGLFPDVLTLPLGACKHFKQEVPTTKLALHLSTLSSSLLSTAPAPSLSPGSTLQSHL